MSTRALRLVLALLLLFTSGASALEFKQHRWGFDQKAVPGRFNILSVLVYEPGPRAFDGEITLLETRGASAFVGAPLVQQVYVTPGTSRWVQFAPFVSGDYEWVLRWGSGEKNSAKIDPPALGPPATVVILDDSSPFAQQVSLSVFSEELFPTNVAATDGLDQVVLDHQPRWDAPRRQAFLDWVRRGGVVHLVRSAGGLPSFDGELAPLNTILTRERVGSGTIVRHEILRSECSGEYLSSAGFPVRKKDETENQGSVYYNLDQAILQSLAATTKPEVAWWLLYLLTIGYLVVIGPVHYRWSRTVDFKIAIGGFLGTVAVFALAFMIAGRRGAGETQTVHSLAVARALPGGRWDTQQWASAFATSGDYYRFTYNSPAAYFSASNNVEAVNGKAYGGKDGHFDADIPLYSSRPFLSRAVLEGPDFGVHITEWEGGKVSIQTGAGFPSAAREVWARRGDRMLQLHRTSDGWSPSGDSLALDEFFKGKSNSYSGYDYIDQNFKPEESMRPLLANFLSERRTQYRFTARPLARDQLQLFVFAPSPATFALKGKGFKGEEGWTLFVCDVFREEKRNDSK